jgi:hypothetical protein
MVRNIRRRVNKEDTNVQRCGETAKFVERGALANAVD